MQSQENTRDILFFNFFLITFEKLSAVCFLYKRISQVFFPLLMGLLMSTSFCWQILRYAMQL